MKKSTSENYTTLKRSLIFWMSPRLVSIYVRERKLLALKNIIHIHIGKDICPDFFILFDYFHQNTGNFNHIFIEYVETSNCMKKKKKK